MDINLDFSEIQYTFSSSKQKSNVTLLDSLTFKVKKFELRNLKFF